MATRRSHPPTLLTLARRAIEQGHLISPGTTVLAAVSGGPDSMALLHVLALLGPKMGFAVVAHGVDHGLRPEAGAELALAAALAARLGVPMETTAVAVPAGGNLQARAREARHEALAAAARRAGAARVATGHHADDRAETVLMRLLQGSGPRGLACLPPRQGELIRPFLLARRADIVAHLARHGVESADDPSNKNSRFLRARVRAELMPLLEALSPSAVSHLNALADELISLQIPGDPAGLGRAQRQQLQAAEGAGRPGALLRVAGGREVWVAVAPGRSMLSYEDTNHPPADARDESPSTPAPVGGNLEVTRASSTTTTLVGPSKVRS